MVRAGIVLYGVSPSAQTQGMPPLCPVMSLRAVIAQIKDLKKGDTVSYGCTFCAPRDMRVAVVPVGYADGYLRRCSERGAYLLIRGKRAPIVGRVCMDQLMLDVTDIESVSTSDLVTVLGRDGEETVTGLLAAIPEVTKERICAAACSICPDTIYFLRGKEDEA